MDPSIPPSAFQPSPAQHNVFQPSPAQHDPFLLSPVQPDAFQPSPAQLDSLQPSPYNETLNPMDFESLGMNNQPRVALIMSPGSVASTYSDLPSPQSIISQHSTQPDEPHSVFVESQSHNITTDPHLQEIEQNNLNMAIAASPSVQEYNQQYMKDLMAFPGASSRTIRKVFISFARLFFVLLDI